MKIVAFEVADWEHATFAQLAREHEVIFKEDALNAENAAEHADAEVISAFIYSALDKAVLEQFANLKLIATRSTGYDHIDLDYCRQKNISICNVPNYGENTVAEHVFGLLLTISHKLDQAVERTRKGDFSSKGLQGFDLQGKTIGIIGTGSIGLQVIRIANGFAMKVLAFDVKRNEEAARSLNFEYADFTEVLQRADVISLHVPNTPKTRNMLDVEEFNQMKDGVVLINTARGPLISMTALIRALAEGKVQAAGLDVLPEEPVIREEAELLRSVYQRKHNLESLLADHVVLRLRNVIVTPHSAFNTREAVQRIIETTVMNIDSFINGSPRNIVATD